jgi:hypothetical protein
MERDIKMIECSLCNKPKFRNDMSCDCIECVSDLKQQLKEANEVIEFYGNEKKYYICPIDSYGEILDDEGQHAREYKAKWGIK